MVGTTSRGASPRGWGVVGTCRWWLPQASGLGTERATTVLGQWPLMVVPSWSLHPCTRSMSGAPVEVIRSSWRDRRERERTSYTDIERRDMEQVVAITSLHRSLGSIHHGYLDHLSHQSIGPIRCEPVWQAQAPSARLVKLEYCGDEAILNAKTSPAPTAMKQPSSPGSSPTTCQQSTPSIHSIDVS